MTKIFEKYLTCPELSEIQEMIIRAKEQSGNLKNRGVALKSLFSYIDLTSLNSTDTDNDIVALCETANAFQSKYKQLELPSLAAICVYPSFLKIAKQELDSKKLKLAAVSGGFPSSQTFIEIKTMETRMAVENGADEIDMVVSVGKCIENNWEEVGDEIRAIKEACGAAHLKVILETGALNSYENIYKASIVALEAGGDFIKTSTGKLKPAATPEAFFIMAFAVKQYYNLYKEKRGLKAAGGISTGRDALIYNGIINNVLGKDWLCPGLFRIGASSLVNNLIGELQMFEK